MEKLTTEDIARILVEKNGLSQQAAENFVRQMFSVVKDAIERDKLVKVKGLGAFKVVDVEARESINVNTGERVLIEGHGKISFTPDATMKELVNKPFSQFETVALNEGVTFDDMPADDEEDDEDEKDAQEEKVEAKPLPVTEEPHPIVEEPTPIAEEPQPIVEEPTPIAEEVQPIAEEPKPIAEEPTQEPQQQAATSETLEQDDSTEEDEPSTPSDDEEEEVSTDTAKWIVAGVISLVLIVLAACAGYIYGLNKGRAEMRAMQAEEPETSSVAPQSHDSILAALHPEEPVMLDEAQKQKDSINAAKAEADAKAKAEADAKTKADAEAKAKAEADAKAKQEQAAKVEPYSKYEQMDARVRTGAYRIVGVDRTVTVKKGETLKRISKTYLGEGMECYVEVLNGLSSSSELKEGSKLKIPKLELKKKGK